MQLQIGNEVIFIFNISDKNNKKALQKLTNSCERCFQRGHLAHNCSNPLRNKKYKNNP